MVWYSLLNFRFYNYNKERLSKTVYVFVKKANGVFLKKRRHPVGSGLLKKIEFSFNSLYTYISISALCGSEPIPDVGHNIIPMQLCVCRM